MLMYRVVPMLLVAPVMIYLYILLLRLLKLFCRRPALWMRLAAALAAFLLARPVKQIFGLYAAVLLHLLASFAATDLGFLLWRRCIRKKEDGTGQGRRRFWELIRCTGVIPVLVTALIFGYAYLNMHQIRRTEYTVYTEKKIQENGYRVVFLSDLHYATTMDADKLERICREMEACSPDLVILGGDIVDERSTVEEVRTAFSLLAGIDSRYGTFYVYGNHDRGIYAQNCAFSAGELTQMIEESGVRILQDETVALNDELTVSGREDRTGARQTGVTRADSKLLLEGAPEHAYHILADHQPREFAENEEAGFDLMLSGHTHGGQMWPVGLITELFDRETVNYGQTQKGGMDVIVSSGLAGWGYAFRTGKHSEYVLVRIQRYTENDARPALD